VPARVQAPHGVLVVTLAAFVALTLAVLAVDVERADSAARHALLAAASPAVIAAMRVINLAGDWKFLLPATILLIAAFPRARRTWWVWLALMLAAPLAEGAVKLLVARTRPEALSYGFPSGHATAAAAYFGALLYLSEPLPALPRRALRLIALAMIVLVGIARVMLRAHWPSDVLGGFALGLALASAATVWASSSSAAPARAPRGS
jgi:undecaprenyl-diphosphatase